MIDRFLGDLFWTVATSYPVLAVIGAVLLGALVVGYFPLLKWFPVVGDFVGLAKLVSFLAVALLMLLVGFRLADERDARKSIEMQLAAKTIDLQITQAATESKDKELIKLKTLASERQKRIDAYAAERKALAHGACIVTADDLRSRLSNRR